jgi:hypothetical protein
MFRSIKCKNIYAVELSLEIRKSIERIEEFFFDGLQEFQV